MMHITSKGQVTIPKEFRDKYGFMPDTLVEFVERGGKLTLEKPKERSLKGKQKLSIGAKAVRWMSGRGDVRMTTEEIMALTRGE